MTVFAPTAIRASELARCARMAALRGRGAEHEEHDDLAHRYFARGHLYTDYVCRQLEAKYGKGNVQREVEIEWPLGVGHADAYVAPEKLLVEVKSTVAPSTSAPMFEMAVTQLRIYLRFHPEAERGALYLINPSSLAGEDVFEVRLADGDRAEIDAAVADVKASLEGGALPPRVCLKPGQARGRLCQFAASCFEGWQPEESAETLAIEAVEAAGRLATLKQQERPLKEQLAAIDEAKRETQAELAALVDVGETVAGPWKITRTHVCRQPTFSVKAFEAAGHSLESLTEFFKPGAEYDTFRVARAEEAGEIDFGSEAPWSSADLDAA